MNDNQTSKRAYVKPETEVIATGCCTQLLNGSFQGGHNGGVSGGDLGDSGDNGHNPVEPGGGLGDAKRGFFDLDGWDEAKGGNIWEE